MSSSSDRSGRSDDRRSGGKGGSRGNDRPGGKGGSRDNDRSSRDARSDKRSDNRGRSDERNRSGGGRDNDRDAGRNDRDAGRSAVDRRRTEREGEPREDRRRVREPYKVGPKSWGGVARRGAGWLERAESEDSPERKERTANRRPKKDEEEENPNWDRVKEEAEAAVSKVKKPIRRPHRTVVVKRGPLPEAPRRLPEGDTMLVRLLGDKAGRRAAKRLRDAGEAFQEERFVDARRTLYSLEERAPDVAEVVEMSGLILYRLGRWREAAKKMERFRELTGSTEQHPVLADCYRALGWWADVDELWIELRDASPSAALVTEGRLVAAGTLADQDKLKEAVALMEKGWSFPKRAREHHLRRAYALADLYEQSASIPRARDLFVWVQRSAPGFADVDQRLKALR